MPVGPLVLMIGPPGTGKTLLARRLATIMPALTPTESLETTRIYSAMGLLRAGQPLMAVRPFRHPHHPFRHPHHSVADAGRTDKVLRVARTMADRDGSEAIRPQNSAEAVDCRSLDRGVWAG